MTHSNFVGKAEGKDSIVDSIPSTELSMFCRKQCDFNWNSIGIPLGFHLVSEKSWRFSRNKMRVCYEIMMWHRVEVTGIANVRVRFLSSTVRCARVTDRRRRKMRELNSGDKKAFPLRARSAAVGQVSPPQFVSS